MPPKLVTFGLLGTTLDAGAYGEARWERWRPTVSVSIDGLTILVREPQP